MNPTSPSNDWGNNTVEKQQQFIESYGNPEFVLSALSEGQRQVITLYFGLAGSQPQTLSEIGAHLNLKKQRVGQIKSAALKKLQAVSNQPSTPPDS